MKVLKLIGTTALYILRKIGNAVFPMLSASLAISRQNGNSESEESHSIEIQLRFGIKRKKKFQSLSPNLKRMTELLEIGNQYTIPDSRD